jgi:hypothetical protein
MRPVYATYLEFQPGTNAKDVHRQVCAWLTDRARAPRTLHDTWGRLGREVIGLPAKHGILDLDVIKVGDDQLWQSAWSAPSDGDRSLNIIHDICVADIDGRASASVVLRIERQVEQLAPLRYNIRPPSLVRELAHRFPCEDAGLRMTSKPRPLTEQGVERFVNEILLNSRRARPVLLLTVNCGHEEPVLDAEDLARDLCGLAHVYTATDRETTYKLSDLLPGLSAWGGAIRLYWPGMTRFDDPRDHPYYTPQTVVNWEGKPMPLFFFRRICAIATTTLASPQKYVELRRRARRTRVMPGQDVPEEWLEEMERALDERDRAERELERAHKRVAQLEAQLHATRARHFRNGHHPDAQPVLRSVLDAVEAAAERCPHLVFVPQAFETAKQSPFERPEVIYDALMKLEELAARYARPEGIGTRLVDAARSMGLDFAGGVSKVAMGRARGESYFAWWPQQRRKVPLGPHVKLGSGRGAGKIARIYMYLHDDCDEPADRRFVIGHVGRILENTTTG